MRGTSWLSLIDLSETTLTQQQQIFVREYIYAPRACIWNDLHLLTVRHKDSYELGLNLWEAWIAVDRRAAISRDFTRYRSGWSRIPTRKQLIDALKFSVRICRVRKKAA